ncbi:DNA-dependent ATPase RAD54 [Sugiyamaella lignohabitans]|uniref:DNA-dependent ATPase RAD54 n=1 Tax=Sugiyamaella lignohabitans TaxID=796027 RepID=A0A167CNW1_9ASCO|nr:DNA-dependent ATPase RAD54 [Sugiyamaella lignohabitans]ANB11936.1 DNA-dependent ATPase RAD54 [Sugiyamaella lignohabitans]
MMAEVRPRTTTRKRLPRLTSSGGSDLVVIPYDQHEEPTPILQNTINECILPDNGGIIDGYEPIYLDNETDVNLIDGLMVVPDHATGIDGLPITPIDTSPSHTDVMSIGAVLSNSQPTELSLDNGDTLGEIEEVSTPVAEKSQPKSRKESKSKADSQKKSKSSQGSSQNMNQAKSRSQKRSQSQNQIVENIALEEEENEVKEAEKTEENQEVIKKPKSLPRRPRPFDLASPCTPIHSSAIRRPQSAQNSPLGINKRLKTDPLSTITKPFRVPTKSAINANRPFSRRDDLSRSASRKIKSYAEIENIETEQFNKEIEQPASPYTPGGGIKRLGTKVDPALKNSIDASDMILGRRFITPLKEKPLNMGPSAALGMKRRHEFVPRPLHDPSGEFAIVLFDPTIDDEPVEEIDPNKIVEGSEDENLGETEVTPVAPTTPSKPSLADILGLSNEKKKVYPKVPVVIDPRLAKILRPHQVEGVKFLYKCVTGRVQKDANGCIMADEMGLGKTLQCITLMWTLLKQSPEGNGGTISKCIVVCPSSLVRNWANELVKWLGEGAITPLAADGKSVKNADLSAALRQWSTASGRQIVRPVLIISYETLRRHCDDLRNTEIGLLLADEGHRLKNGESLTFTALDALNVQRRVILSGTPIQNDLSEYFSLLSFANPGLLGTRLEFRKNYENAILKGRDSFATEEEVTDGETKLKELSLLVSRFIIRRTNDILSKYLPVKYEHVVFCNMTEFQINLYNKFIASPDVKKVIKGSKNNPLKSIGILKKLCNHPDLLDLSRDIQGAEDVLPSDYVHPSHRGGRDRGVRTLYSGKFMVLERMLARIRYETNDKIVIISNYTQTLDLIEAMCRESRYGAFRLDGKMAISKRQKLVDKFNDPEGSEFVFLLSSKAGGCGINLIGANRLILMDPDWNPAADQQALARVWRDGQKKDCFVYRFISTGSIEEKIFQRQSMKQSLSSCVVDEAEDVERLFSFNDLKKLFSFDGHTLSDTHDTFKCKRCKDNRQVAKAPAMLYGDATTWNHFTKPELENIQDLLLRQELTEEIVSFVFQYISH